MSPVRGEDDLSGDREPGRGYREGREDREVSLGTTTLLGIFFALALVCAVFFGFGYTLGRRSAQAAVPVTAGAVEPPASDSFKSFKPSPGSPAAAPAEGAAGGRDAGASTDPGFATAYPPPSSVANGDGTAKTVVVAPARPAFDPDAEIVTSGTPAPAAKSLAPVRVGGPSTPAVPLPSGAGSVVQISAFHRQEDADMEAAELRKKGYNVAVRHEPQDAFLHVQLGPYATKKEAEAMRDRLLADGFNAIVK